MASTNKTTHYELPQWIGTDKPTFLGDMNQAYEDIDTAIYNAATAASNAASAAGSAQSAAATAQSAAESAGSTASAANTLATTANTNAVAALNAIGSSTLETVAQTINAAVNEVLGKLKANGQVAQVTYDSTSQKYGVTIDQVFYPFEDSADFQAELYDALQYSGLVEEGDTVDEMLAALAAYFPEEIYIFNNGNQETETTGGWFVTSGSGTVASIGASALQFSTGGTAVSGGYQISTNNQITIPSTATKLCMDVSDGTGGSQSTIAWVGMAATQTTSYNNVTHKATSVGLINGTFEVDVTDIAGQSMYATAGLQINANSICSANITNIYFK